MIRVAVFGATGYVGCELVALLCAHPNIKISYVCSFSFVGLKFSDICLASSFDMTMSSFEEVDFLSVDVVFLCLPHGVSHDFVLRIPDNIKIIDLSADFRIHDIKVYEQWYGKHNSFNLVKNFVYGLSEVYPKRISEANFVACPGCYSTSVLLPLIPLLRVDLIKDDSIVIDSKSGASGSGKTLKTNNIFCEVNESIKAYAISEHRHIPEIEQELCYAAKKDHILVQFTPNLMPINRGILTNIYITLNVGVSINDLKKTLIEFYQDSVFVELNNNKSVTTASVVGNNRCYVGVFPGRREGTAIITSSIDNLLKGASGQALQNLNLMFNFPENLGLRL